MSSEREQCPFRLGDHSLVVKRKDGADSVERAVTTAAAWLASRQ